LATASGSTRPPRETGNVKWERVASVPSIPAGSRRFGFEETATGELVPQGPPPAPSAAALGPTVPPDAFVSRNRHAPAPTFAKSKTTREVWGSDKPLHKLPGPADYAPFDQEAIGAAFVPSPSDGDAAPAAAASTSRYLKAKPSAVFSSKATKHAASPLDALPGPGAYETASAARSSFARAAAAAPVARQCFGSRAARSLVHIDAATAAAAATPGPGAYDAMSARAAFPGGLEVDMGGLLPSAPASSSGAAPSGASAAAVAAAAARRGAAGPHGVFRSTTSRFSGAGPGAAAPATAVPTAAVPGPGAYQVTGNIARDMALKSFSRNQTFGSTASRFTAERPAQARAASHPALAGLQGADEAVTRSAGGHPGAAAAAIVAARSASRPSAAFTSKSRRMGAAHEFEAGAPLPATAGEAYPTAAAAAATLGPAPGSYDVDVDGRRRAELAQARGNLHFLSKERRFDSDSQVKAMLLESHLGPGRYNTQASGPLVAAAAPAAAAGSAFKSTQPRFVEPRMLPQEAVSALAAASGPGPGSYGVRQNTLVKRSYNVTIDTPRYT
jgi:hypothetical protein